MAARKSLKAKQPGVSSRPAKAKRHHTTAADFRRIALSLPEATEGAHMGHADFRVGGKIFATLGYPDEHWGVLKLTPEAQTALVRELPAAFVPVKGGWGRSGSTQVRLENVDEPTIRAALLTAWRKTATARLISKTES